MSKLCDDYIEEHLKHLIQTDCDISELENDKYKKNKISSETQMLIYQAKLTSETQKLLLVMLKMVNKICDALEVRNEKDTDTI